MNRRRETRSGIGHGGFVCAAAFAYFGPRVPNAVNAKRVELTTNHDRVRIGTQEATKRLAQR